MSSSLRWWVSFASSSEANRVITEQADRIRELERRLGSDSSNSSRPPSSQPPWADRSRAPRRSSRTGSGRQPGKQPGPGPGSRSLVEDPDRTVEIEPGCCAGCAVSLDDAPEAGHERRQVVDAAPAPAPEITEYQRVSTTCTGCGATTTTPDWGRGPHAPIAVTVRARASTAHTRSPAP